jgi:hypothetical protein
MSAGDAETIIIVSAIVAILFGLYNSYWVLSQKVIT